MPAHRLGPHVVGQRVVIRRLLAGERGPTGGPAFTDVLGICVSWDDDEAVVERESGERITVPIREIVSGKPVPPRPSIRHRVSAAEAERHTAALFDGLETADVAGWTARWEPNPSGRLRKRANSALAMVDPDRPVPEALTAVVEFYTARNREPMVQVEQDTAIEAAVADAGWAAIPGGDSIFLLASIAQVRRALSQRPELPVIVEEPYVRVQREEAIGDAALSDDWLGIHGLEVAPAHRRQGWATTVIAALLEWGAERGARTAWLHVETDNEPAIALYDSLGFSSHHRCRYYRPASP